MTGAVFISGDQTTCEGDSGSGVFDQTQFNAGKWVSYGVLSRGSVSADGQNCVQPIYTRFDKWSSLLLDAAKAAASAGGYALPAWAADAGEPTRVARRPTRGPPPTPDRRRTHPAAAGGSTERERRSSRAERRPARRPVLPRTGPPAARTGAARRGTASPSTVCTTSARARVGRGRAAPMGSLCRWPDERCSYRFPSSSSRRRKLGNVGRVASVAAAGSGSVRRGADALPSGCSAPARRHPDRPYR